jgi:polyhydroxyalkanoate synthase
VPLLRNSHEVRFEIVPGGHLGMLTGRAARRTTWVVMDERIAQYSTPDDRTEAKPSKPARKRAAKKAVARTKTSKTTGTTKKAATRSTPKSPQTPSAPSDVAADRGAIGSNRERRFTSDASRDLAPKR